MKLCICDLGGVVADETERFKRAEEAKQAYLDEMAELQITDMRGATDTYWQTAFDPEHVPLDTLILGVNDALNTLLQQGYKVLFLTSRKVDMKDSTLEWFSLHIFTEAACDIVFKMPAFYYTKTVVWKAGMIQTFAALYGASELVVIDGQRANIEALHKDGFEDSLVLRCYASLAEAVEAIG